MNHHTAKQQLYFLFSLTLVLLLGTACNDPKPVSETSVAVNAEIFVFPGETEKRLISDEKIVQNNCNGAAETSQTVTRQQTVQYTMEMGAGLTVSTEGKVGVPSVGEVSVGAEVATHYKVGYGRQETVSRSVTVATTAGSHIQHTIQQFEVWETGEVLIVAGDKNKRLPYSFRRDFSIEAVAPANLGCQNTPTASPPENSDSDSLPPSASAPQADVSPTTITNSPSVQFTSTPTSPAPIPPDSNSSSRLCPLIVIEGSVSGSLIAQTKTWAELAAQGVTSEPQSANINETCSRDNDNQVQVWVGYWSEDSDYLDFRRTMLTEQAITLVQQNPNQPVIIVPWGE